jgi:hypothetical protein
MIMDSKVCLLKLSHLGRYTPLTIRMCSIMSLSIEKLYKRDLNEVGFSFDFIGLLGCGHGVQRVCELRCYMITFEDVKMYVNNSSIIILVQDLLNQWLHTTCSSILAIVKPDIENINNY